MNPLSELTLEDPEVWLPVPDWEGFYEVSSHGRVRSVDRVVITTLGVPMRRKGRVLKQTMVDHTAKGTYLVPFVTLKRPGIKTPLRVASVVARTFLGEPPEGKTHVLHNGQGQDVNCPSNMRWGDHAENMAETKGIRKNGNKRQRGAILELVSQGLSCRQIAHALGCSRQAVTNARRAQRLREAADA